MHWFKDLMFEMDGLKGVNRHSKIADGSRRENSAEHSWHLAMALMALAPRLPGEVNLNHAIRLALAHDVCEIGAGDLCAYSAARSDHSEEERAYLQDLKSRHGDFGGEMLALWQEYEAQTTLESRWVKVVDQLLPFLLNLANNGETWQARGISAADVARHNISIQSIAPDIYEWMMGELDSAVSQGWIEALKD